jgi:2-polyprenyl-3-methyl-5-hydroxy-6-metoxy-1,4-benzoquinol methylase
METILEHPEAEVTITELANGKRRITVNPEGFWLAEKDKCLETDYPVELIEKVFKVKGPRRFTDHIRREEDPLYIQACLENDILGYASPDEFKGKRILDFGCGPGASSIVLARLFPEAEIVGTDLEEANVSLAKARGDYYKYENVSFYCSPDGMSLPGEIGKFDYIVLSAVFEHLLPNERGPVLGLLWSALKPGGILYLNQTPYRFFPFEGHTTHLFFLNYLPDKVAYAYACKYSKKVAKGTTWDQLLRNGIRGGYPSGIMRILKRVETDFPPMLLKPSRLGLRDRIDIWYRGYAVCIAEKYPKVRNVQRVLRIVAKVIYGLCGIVFLPTVSIAIRKSPAATQT